MPVDAQLMWIRAEGGSADVCPHVHPHTDTGDRKLSLSAQREEKSIAQTQEGSSQSYEAHGSLASKLTHISIEYNAFRTKRQKVCYRPVVGLHFVGKLK